MLRARAAIVGWLRADEPSLSGEPVGITVMTAPDGVRAAAEFTVLGEYLATDEGLPPAKGQSYRLNAGAFFAVRDGKVARVTNYYNLEDWIRQVSG